MLEKLLYMCKKKGFTLVELLVAATIIGILAIFATNSYRNGVAETRWAQAKANLDQLANSIQRMKTDYPGLKFSSEAIINPTADGCLLSSSFYGQGYLSTLMLMQCNYLEKGDWSNEYFLYYACDEKTDDPCKAYSSQQPVACVQIREDAKLPAKYRGYSYCYYGTLGGKENP